ncbi:hypothetical protein [Acinetobacter gerneri]|uniref:hypothetical protein n=1 Tax=Acinetobacter gerneri TaxID=202952 RepID=UPI0032160C6F
MDTKEEYFSEMINHYNLIFDIRNELIVDFKYYKKKINILLNHNDLDKNCFGIFLVQELDENRQVEFLRPLFKIFIYKIGISHRIQRILFFLNKEILTTQLKKIICEEKEGIEFLELSIILNFYKEIDIETSLFFCDFFRSETDEDMNETIDNFLTGLLE